MSKFPLTKVFFVMIVAFIFCLASESVLRQYMVSSVDSKTVNIASLMAKLPPAVRDSIDRRISMGQLRDEIAKAERNGNSAERVQALSNYAEFLNTDADRETIYGEVIDKYPKLLESFRAYLYFLEVDPKKTHSKKISIKDFQNFVLRFEQLEQFTMWMQGLVKIKSAADRRTQVEFLKPLLDSPPEYRDYFALFEYLSQHAAALKDKDLYNKAKDGEDASYQMPSIDTVLGERYMAADEKRRKDNNNAADINKVMKK